MIQANSLHFPWLGGIQTGMPGHNAHVNIGGKAVNGSQPDSRLMRMSIGGKSIAAFTMATTPQNDRRQTNAVDIVDISPLARSLSQSMVGKSEKYGNPTLGDRQIIPVRGQSADGWDDLEKGKMRSLDRFLGQETGTSYGELVKARGNLQGKPHSAHADIGNRADELFVQDVLYGAMRATADAEREAIQSDMKKLLHKHGIDVKDTTAFSFTVSRDGAIQVNSASMNLEQSTIEDILNEDKGLALRMVKNSAMFKLQDTRYDSGSGSSAEMALVNVELQERFGFGLDALGEAGPGGIQGFNADLDAAMAADDVFALQVYTYAGSTASFDAEWSFGNQHIADNTNSAESFMPPQGIGTFAEALYADAKTINSEISFTLTPEGMFNVIDASAEDKEYAMSAMAGLLAEGAANGGLERLKEASERALEEHLTRHGGSKENLDVVITARAGKWSIDVVEKDRAVKKPSEDEEMHDFHGILRSLQI